SSTTMRCTRWLRRPSRGSRCSDGVSAASGGGAAGGTWLWARAGPAARASSRGAEKERTRMAGIVGGGAPSVRALAGALRVHGLLHHPVEVLARRQRLGVARAAAPVAIGDDDQLALRVDEDALAEDAAGGEAAVVVGPPLVAVAAPGLADVGLLAGRFLQPALGHDALAADARAF